MLNLFKEQILKAQLVISELTIWTQKPTNIKTATDESTDSNCLSVCLPVCLPVPICSGSLSNSASEESKQSETKQK